MKISLEVVKRLSYEKTPFHSDRILATFGLPCDSVVYDDAKIQQQAAGARVKQEERER